LANCSANSETPPVPCVTTTEPGLIAPCSTTADHAVSAAQGKVAAASVEREGGRGTSADSAILVTLPPGAYTAEVSGASGDTGVALVEVYEVP